MINLRTIIFFLLALALLISSASAQSGGDYDLSWTTIDSGGGISTGADYALTGTIAQPDPDRISSCLYYLSGGFWFAPPGIVDLDDLAVFVAEWLLTESEVGYELPADLNNDGCVDLADYNWLAVFWLCYCPDDWPSW